MLKSKSWRKQTCFKIQFYIGIQLRWNVFEQFWFSASPSVYPLNSHLCVCISICFCIFICILILISFYIFSDLYFQTCLHLRPPLPLCRELIILGTTPSPVKTQSEGGVAIIFCHLVFDHIICNMDERSRWLELMIFNLVFKNLFGNYVMLEKFTSVIIQKCSLILVSAVKLVELIRVWKSLVVQSSEVTRNMRWLSEVMTLYCDDTLVKWLYCELKRSAPKCTSTVSVSQPNMFCIIRE